MKTIQSILRGVLSDGQLNHDMEALDQPTVELINRINQHKKALAAVFGRGEANDPFIVAQFIKANALHDLALEARALREVLANGTGAITIGIERST